LKTIRHIFFDLDDTLWDFQYNSNLVLKELYAEYQLEQRLQQPAETFLKVYKGVNLDLWSRFERGEISKSHLRSERFLETFSRMGGLYVDEHLEIGEAYISRAPKGRKLKAGCLETLEYLYKKYSLHIITNGIREIQHIKIDNGGIRDYFTHIIISEEHGFHKPHEEIFRLAEKNSGASTEECLMVGDSLESDVKGALNAGWQAIHVDNDNNAVFPGTRIRELSELKSLL